MAPNLETFTLKQRETSKKYSRFRFMGLDESCLDYWGGLIAVKPVAGWGWSRLDAPEIPVPNQINGVPFPFHCYFETPLYFDGELRGAACRIEETGHIYNKFWMFFYNRTCGIFDFEERLPYCNLEISPKIPTVRRAWFDFTSGVPLVNGYAFAGASIKHIEEHHAKMMAGLRP